MLEFITNHTNNYSASQGEIEYATRDPEMDDFVYCASTRVEYKKNTYDTEEDLEEDLYKRKDILDKISRELDTREYAIEKKEKELDKREADLNKNDGEFFVFFGKKNVEEYTKNTFENDYDTEKDLYKKNKILDKISKELDVREFEIQNKETELEKRETELSKKERDVYFGEENVEEETCFNFRKINLDDDGTFYKRTGKKKQTINERYIKLLPKKGLLQ